MTAVLEEPRPDAPAAGDREIDAVLGLIADEVRVVGNALCIAGHAHTLPGAGHREAAQWIAHALYHRYYHRHEDRDPAVDPFARRDSARRPATALEDPIRGRALREALAGRFVWESGWVMLGALPDLGMTQVERDGLVLCVAPDELRPEPDGWAVRFPAQRPFASAGYFSVIGASGGPGNDGDLVRCYLHLTAAGAIRAFTELVEAMDQQGIPFSAKVANNDDGFDRPDSAVLYVQRGHLRAALRAVAAVSEVHADTFEESVPAFTCAVAPGVGLADEPSQDHGPISFGQHRCALIADALIAAGPHASTHARLERILDTLRGAGLDPSRLHLGPDTADYDVNGHDINGYDIGGYDIEGYDVERPA